MTGWFLLGICLIGFFAWGSYSCWKQRKLTNAFNRLSHEEQQAIGNIGLAHSLISGKTTCNLSSTVIQSLITKGIIVYFGFARKSSTELLFADLHLSEHGKQLYQVYRDSISFDW